MNREQFRKALMTALKNLPEEEITKSADFYDEMIDDRMEEGMSEEAAVASLEPVEQIAERIICETPMPKLIRQRVSGYKLSALSIVLLVIGSPLWLSVGLALVAVLVSAMAALWSVVAALGACALALALSVPAALIYGILALTGTGGLLGAGICLAAALLCAGLAILVFFAAKYSAIGLVRLTAATLKGIKAMFVHKEEQ